MGAGGRPRKFKTAEDLATAWEAYKQKCDNNTAIKTEFCQRTASFVTAKIPSPITYTIEGFCADVGLARSCFYDYYADNPKYADIVSRMKEESEADVRLRFETGEIPSQLSALWMSKFGYSTKSDTNVTGAVPVVIGGGDQLED